MVALIKKKSLVMIVFGIFLISFLFAGIVSAETYVNTFGKESARNVYVEGNNIIKKYSAGWNLVVLDANTNPSNIQTIMSDFPASEVCDRTEMENNMFIYYPVKSKYVSGEELEKSGGIGDEVANFLESNNYLFGSSAGSYWVYFDRPCYALLDKQNLEEAVEYRGEVRDVGLYEGWNFISLVPQMQDKSLENIKGNCELISAYSWDEFNQEWESQNNFDWEFDFDEGALGTGLLIKVQDNCELNFGSSSSSSGVPSLPSSSTTNSDKNLVANGFKVEQDGTDVEILLDYDEIGLEEGDNYYVEFSFYPEMDGAEISQASIVSKAALELNGFSAETDASLWDSGVDGIVVIASMDYSFTIDTESAGSWEHYNMVDETNEDEEDNCIAQEFILVNSELAPEYRTLSPVGEVERCGS